MALAACPTSLACGAQPNRIDTYVITFNGGRNTIAPLSLIDPTDFALVPMNLFLGEKTAGDDLGLLFAVGGATAGNAFSPKNNSMRLALRCEPIIIPIQLESKWFMLLL